MRAIILPVISGVFVSFAFAGEALPFRVHGQAWTEMGRIMHSSDSVQTDNAKSTINLNGASRQGLGAQLGIEADLGDNWNSAFGMGVRQVTNSIGESNGSDEPSFAVISLYKSYVSQAWLRYYQGKKEQPWFSMTIGSFAYDYNPDVKNLGLYLLRGPVYPGILMSGFQEFDVDSTKSSQTGLRIHHALGNFTHDLLFLNERVLPPTFDWSLAYVAKYRAFDAFDFGFGVNFYRLVPYQSSIETPGKLPGSDPANYEVLSPGDTLFYTHQGIKLMGMFSLDLKPLFSIENMGPNDFKLYGEVGVIGVKNYGSVYNKITERIPVMGGFNVPTFNFLDIFALEVEWYGSKHRNDIGKLGNVYNRVADWTNYSGGTEVPSPVPAKGVYADSTLDNWKWSVLAQKTVAKHIQFTAQVANDHTRPYPVATGGFIWMAGGTAGVLTRPSDWYYTARIGFLF